MKITPVTYQAFIVSYYQNPKFKHQRFGQAFVNEFFTEGMTDPDLFYALGTDTAMEIISEKYINFEQE